MRAVRRGGAALAVLVLLVAAVYAAIELGVPVGGISRGDAIQRSVQEIPSTTTPVTEWAIVAPLGLFRGGASELAAPWKQVVWVVRLSGTYAPGSCGPAPAPGQQPHCPPDDHTATVMLDYRTGTFVMATLEP